MMAWLRRKWLAWRYIKVCGEGGHLSVDPRWYVETGAWAKAMEGLRRLDRKELP